MGGTHLIHGMPSGGVKRSKPTEIVMETSISANSAVEMGRHSGSKGDKGVFGAEWEREIIYVMLRLMQIGFGLSSYLEISFIVMNVRWRS